MNPLPAMNSMNPFKAKPAETTTGQESPNMLASTSRSIGKATKAAFNKTTGAVTGLFARNDSSADQASDPLSLDTENQKVGPDVFVANGQLWESTGNVSKAMESYAKALESEPNHGPALTSIARLHFRESNFPQAAEYFQKAIAQQPEDAALYNDLGLTLSKLGQHQMAGQTIARALQLAPGTSRYANNLASVYFEAGQSEQAYQVLAQNNKPAVAHFNMAYLHYKKGQAQRAQSHLQQAMQHESQAEADPATKRAIERSREMLAQLNPGGAAPATNPAAAKPGIGPAAGPAAVIAAAPSHRAGGASPVVAPNGSPQAGQASQPQPVVPGTTSPVNYQDPRSYMSPQMPSGSPGAASTAQPTAPNVGTAPAAKAPAGTSPGGSSTPGNYQLPPGFNPSAAN